AGRPSRRTSTSPCGALGGNSTVVCDPVVRNRNAARSCSISLDNQVCSHTRSTIVVDGVFDSLVLTINGNISSARSAANSYSTAVLLFLGCLSIVFQEELSA